MLVTLQASSYSIIYRLCDGIEFRGFGGKVLTFSTRSICLGNGIDNCGRECHRLFGSSVISGLESIVSNPIMVLFEPTIVDGVTIVTVYPDYFESFKIETEGVK
jgi:hypothetical protein